MRIIDARGLRFRTPIMVAQHRLADVQFTELLECRLGKALALAVDLVVTGRQAEGKHFILGQFPQRLLVDHCKLQCAGNFFFQPCGLVDHFHVVYSSPAAAPPFLCALSSGHRSSGT